MEKGQTAEELLDRAYQLGFEYERFYRGCSQCAIAAIYPLFRKVFRANSLFKGSEYLQVIM